MSGFLWPGGAFMSLPRLPCLQVRPVEHNHLAAKLQNRRQGHGRSNLTCTGLPKHVKQERKIGRLRREHRGACEAWARCTCKQTTRYPRLRNEATCRTEQAKIPALRDSAHTRCRQKHARNLSLVRTTALPNLHLSCLSLHTSHTQPPAAGTRDEVTLCSNLAGTSR